ncbi:MAG: fructose bisphosphate aldolase [Rhodobacteraceae bacterium]|nr:fructose bisphosphate aldolase [Paracoccaceae bacterium]
MSLSRTKLERMSQAPGFIAALDHSGGSTPGVLARYGMDSSDYAGEEEMFNLIHGLRSRIMTSPGFRSEHIIGTILFARTMEGTVGGLPTAQYLWEKRGILAILKVDIGLEAERGGVHLMKPIPGLRPFLENAVEKGVVATKMRSVVDRATRGGINEIVAQQFEVARTIMECGLVPIVEPEVSINSAEKRECEEILHRELMDHIESLDASQRVALKLTPPEVANLYADQIAHERVVRVTALSGGYDRDEACRRLGQNRGMIASFSRALTEGLHKNQSDREFDDTLEASIRQIYAASVA